MIDRFKKSALQVVVLQLRWILITTALLIITSVMLLAQEEDPSHRTRVDLAVTQQPETIKLTAQVRARIGRSYVGIEGVAVNFFDITDTVEVPLGKGVTEENGSAQLGISLDNIAADTAGQISFLVRFAGNDTLQANEEEISVQRALIEMTPTTEDSTLFIQASLFELKNEGKSPVPETDVALYVQRLFSLLKIGEGSTDDEGNVTISVPSDLPGDNEGNLDFVAIIEDHESFGNVESRHVEKWGIPVSDVSVELPRALWSPNPPLGMILLFFILMLAVWGHYAAIIYKLFLIKREGDKSHS